MEFLRPKNARPNKYNTNIFKIQKFIWKDVLPLPAKKPRAFHLAAGTAKGGEILFTQP